MTGEGPAEGVAFLGFDSAWTDNPKAPGAIAGIVLRDGAAPVFHPPRLVRFAEALATIREVAGGAACALVALDQPTIVANATSMRPVERVAASTISWLGGGVQPSNRGRTGMFCDDAPIWRFLRDLGAIEDPLAARSAASGLHLVEVFPALALASLDPAFFGRKAAPRYNPARRKTFRAPDWVRVCAVIAGHFDRLGLCDASQWCRGAAGIAAPGKADQDRLDSMICLLVALLWRLSPASETMMLGNLTDGYMVLPATGDVRARLSARARLISVPFEEHFA